MAKKSSSSSSPSSHHKPRPQSKKSSSSSSSSPSGNMARLLSVLALLTALLSSVVYVMEQNLSSFYIFDRAHLHDVARRGIARHGTDTRAIVSYIVDELHERHPEHVNVAQDEWVFNNAGGAMGAMYIIHASVTEYLIIFGTAVGTEGHSGRHTADDYFHILTGTQTAFVPGAFEPEVYPAGSVHHLRRGDVKQYRMPESCFALEYARGWIPPMLFFGFADGLSSTLDLPTLWHTTRITGREMISNLLKGKI